MDDTADTADTGDTGDTGDTDDTDDTDDSVHTPAPPAGDLAAGAFGPWLAELQQALAGEGETDVPCGGCTACCSSSQFVHIGPDEADPLAHIPPALLFPAPHLPPGHKVMGYDEHGRCPMLTGDGCSIYEHRPQACRTYDCRIYAATGLEPEQPLIAQRVRHWRFDVADPADRTRQAELRSTVVELRRRQPDAAVTAVALEAIDRLRHA